ncbi:hypothetical protein BDD12DRAFT_895753 [Trichophaea hybrida]|nr:hypothetical protein BDD12DRAFT_895753 [Trichophaea hybrida]
MDPLSLAASIASLLALGGRISNSFNTFLSTVSSAPHIATYIRYETESLTAIFEQMQNHLLQCTFPRTGRTSIITVEYLIVIFTTWVVAFSKLEAELNGLETSDETRWWERIRWAQIEPALKAVVQKLALHTSSLNLMLTVLFCESNAVAEVAIDLMHAQVEMLGETPESSIYQDDDNASTIRPGNATAVRMVSPRSAGIVATYGFDFAFEETQENSIYQEEVNTSTVRPRNITAVRTVSSRQDRIAPTRRFYYGFEDTLYKSRVYSRTVKNTTTSSFVSLHTFGSNWTQLTGLSLSPMSHISVIFLPICGADLLHACRWFDFGFPTSSTNCLFIEDEYHDDQHQQDMRPQGCTENCEGTCVSVFDSRAHSPDQPEDNDAETIRPKGNLPALNPTGREMILLSGYLQLQSDTTNKVRLTIIGEMTAGMCDLMQLSGEDLNCMGFDRKYANNSVSLRIVETFGSSDSCQNYRDSTFRRSNPFLFFIRTDVDLYTTLEDIGWHVDRINMIKEPYNVLQFMNYDIIIFHNQNAQYDADDNGEEICQWAMNEGIFHNQSNQYDAEDNSEKIRQSATNEGCTLLIGDKGIGEQLLADKVFLQLATLYINKVEERSGEIHCVQEREVDQWMRDEQWKKPSIWRRKLLRANDW